MPRPSPEVPDVEQFRLDTAIRALARQLKESGRLREYKACDPADVRSSSWLLAASNTREARVAVDALLESRHLPGNDLARAVLRTALVERTLADAAVTSAAHIPPGGGITVEHRRLAALMRADDIVLYTLAALDRRERDAGFDEHLTAAVDELRAREVVLPEEQRLIGKYVAAVVRNDRRAVDTVVRRFLARHVDLAMPLPQDESPSRAGRLLPRAAEFVLSEAAAREYEGTEHEMVTRARADAVAARARPALELSNGRGLLAG